jgi:hypothetical protein
MPGGGGVGRSWGHFAGCELLSGGTAGLSEWPYQWSTEGLTFCFDPQSSPDQGKQGGIEHDSPITV